MRFGFASLAAPEMPLKDFIAQAALAGYDGLELRGADRKHLDPAMSAPERAEVRRMLADAGLEAAAVTSYVRLAEAAADPAAGREAILAYVALAADVGAACVRVFGGEAPPDVPRDAAEGRMADLLLAVADEARAAGVRVCLETHDACRTGRDVRRVLDRAKHPAIGALWDVHHPWAHGEPPAETFRLLGERLGYLHLKDAFPLGDGGTQLCFLGAGDVPVREIVGILRSAGFAGYAVVEWEKAWHPELAAADVAMVQHIRKLRAYVAAAG